VNYAVNAVLPAATPAVSINPMQFWTTVNTYVWVVGVAVMLIYGVVSFVILKRKMEKSAHIGSNIYEAEYIKSPFVLGVLRPKIYLPVGLSEHERGYILLHEQTHIRRHDHIIKFGAYFILCLHWFNPLVWVAFLLMGEDMEMSCDERVLKELGGDIRDDYSMSLVRIAAGRRILNGSPLAFGEGGMKERIKRVLNFKKPSRVVIVLAVAFVALFSVGFAVNQFEPKGTMNLVIVNNSSAEIFSFGLFYVACPNCRRQAYIKRQSSCFR
jgi:beta-lactamase regulating signal transducer with metallopeptidase domain